MDNTKLILIVCNFVPEKNLQLNKPLFLSISLTVLVWSTWYGYSTPHTLSIIKDNWPVTLTMVFGSFIAGATSEGGGAVAFPVFTKVLHIAPQDAKIFSLAIQSIGMVAAGATRSRETIDTTPSLAPRGLLFLLARPIVRPVTTFLST